MTKRRTRVSRLVVPRTEIAALVSMTMGRDAASGVRYGARFLSHVHHETVPDAAWHPATQLTRGQERPHNDRGSAEDRRRRKRYLLDTYGDGQTCRCAFCGAELSYETVTVDRYPIPGRAGGRYTRDNVRPACGPCNTDDQGRAGMLAITEGATT